MHRIKKQLMRPVFDLIWDASLWSNRASQLWLLTPGSCQDGPGEARWWLQSLCSCCPHGGPGWSSPSMMSGSRLWAKLGTTGQGTSKWDCSLSLSCHQLQILSIQNLYLLIVIKDPRCKPCKFSIYLRFIILIWKAVQWGKNKRALLSTFEITS